MSQVQSQNSLVYDVGDRPVPGHTIVRVLGEGAMGKVWLAQTDNGFERALKVVDHLQDSTGRKEYRGLRTVKQRKLLNGNLLTLIDYWLKDASGNLVPDVPDSEVESVLGPARPDTGRSTGGMDATTSQKLDKTPGRERSHPAAAGTLVDIKDDLPSAQTLVATPQQLKSGGHVTAVQLIVAMELGHKTLSDRLKECRADGEVGIPLDELLANMMDAARGLDYLHREGVLHRDVKPHNIMLVGEVAKVCDYGLVVSADRDLTKTSKAYTPYYASPEAVENQDKLTGRTDQYSLAVSYVELRTGQLPYSSATAPAVYMAKMTGEYHLKQIDNPLVCQVLKRALARDPKERFSTCVEFVRELTKAEHTRKAAGSGAKRLTIAIAALLLAGVGAAFAYPPWRNTLISYLPQRPPAPAPIDPTNPSEPIAEPEPKTSDAESDSPQPEPPRPVPTPISELERVRQQLADDFQAYADGSPSPTFLVEFPNLAIKSEQPLKWFQDLLDHAKTSEPSLARAEPALWELLQQLEALRGQRPTTAPWSWDGLDGLKSSLAQIALTKFLTDDSAWQAAAADDSFRPRLSLLGGGKNPDSLAALVNAEAALLDHRAGKLDAGQLKAQRDLVASLVRRLPKGALADYGNFLQAQFVARSATMPQPDELRFVIDPVLASWPEAGAAPNGDWRTPRRTAQVSDLAVRLADAALAVTDDDILQFGDLKPDAVSKASGYLATAERLGEKGPYFRGLRGIVRAISQADGAPGAEWAKISADVQAGVDDAEAKSLLSRAGRQQLVAYVGALATARSGDLAGEAQRGQALSFFAEWLDTDDHFREDETADSEEDRGLLENIILPALQIPLPAGATGELAKPLAALWAAQGRIIERQRTVAFRGLEAAAHPHEDARALLTAHQAFARAVELDGQVHYASGFGRTLLKLPREAFDHDVQRPRLSKLIDRFDPKGESSDTGLLLTGAWVLRWRGFEAAQRQDQLALLDDSLRRYGLLLKAVELDDPYGLQRLAQVSASDTHLRAAFLTPIRSADEVRLALSKPPVANKRPTEMTKVEHLNQARDYAQAAQAEQDRYLPQEAFIAEGNALEDLAYYCKLTKNYSDAVAAFERGAKVAREGFHSRAYALVGQGRSEYRAARDAAQLQRNFDDRRQLLRSAFESLNQAVQESNNDQPVIAAEARFWLAHVLQESAAFGPGNLAASGANDADSALAIRDLRVQLDRDRNDLKAAETRLAKVKDANQERRIAERKKAIAATETELRARYANWEQAVNEFRKAEEIANLHWKAQWATVATEGLACREQLARHLPAPAELGLRLTRPELLASVVTDATSWLARVRKDASAMPPHRAFQAIRLLAYGRATQAGGSEAAKAAFGVWQDWESHFDRPGDAWQAQRVSAMLAGCDSGAIDVAGVRREVARAQQIARQISEQQLQGRLLGNCQSTLANALFAALKAPINQGTALSEQQQRDLREAASAYVEAEALLAGAHDPTIDASLKLVRSQRLLNVVNRRFNHGLSDLELDSLLNFISSTKQLRVDATSCSIHLLPADELDPSRISVRFSEKAAPLARNCLDVMKPLFLVEKRDSVPSTLFDILLRIEQKLGP